MRTLYRGFGWLAGGLLLTAFALHCGGGSTGTDPCPNGICSGTGDMAGSGVCTENWICSSLRRRAPTRTPARAPVAMPTTAARRTASRC